MLSCAAIAASAALIVSCAKDVEMEFKEFVEKHVAEIAPLEKESALAYWEAATTGDEKKFERYSELVLELEKVYTDTAEFDFVRKVRESGGLRDGHLERTADLLYLRYLGNQIEPDLIKQMVDLGSRVENKFQVFRAEVDGKRMSSNEVYQVLRESTDSGYRKKVWEASKRVGPVVLDDIRELVGLRNESARRLGYDNYYVMSLELSEQSEDQLVALFEELDDLTREPFIELKAELDVELAARYGIEPDELRPWHYHDPFFQEAPLTSELDLDRYYEGKDPVEIARSFYAGLGMDVDDILSASDLYEREGKNPHAFCTDIDREGDIRILANMKDDNYWMETIPHELGHGVYDKYVDRSLPYMLRMYPHLSLTEASAMYFGTISFGGYRVAKNAVTTSAKLSSSGISSARPSTNLQLVIPNSRAFLSAISRMAFSGSIPMTVLAYLASGNAESPEPEPTSTISLPLRSNISCMISVIGGS